MFSEGKDRKIGKMKRARIIESSIARTKVKDLVPSENKDGWRKPRLAEAGAQP